MRSPAYSCPKTAPRRTSFRRVCQPLPPFLKCPIRSSSSRMVVCNFVGFFCGPRKRLAGEFCKSPLSYAATISGTASVAGRIRARRSSGKTSSTKSAGGFCRFLSIKPYLSFIGFAQSDHTNRIFPPGVNEHVQTRINHSKSYCARLAIIIAQILNDLCRLPVEEVNLLKINAVLK